MSKVLIILVAFVACATAKPGRIAAPLNTAPFSAAAAPPGFAAPYNAYAAPFGYAAPFAVAPLDAFSSSYRLDNFFAAPRVIASAGRFISPTAPFAAYAAAPTPFAAYAATPTPFASYAAAPAARYFGPSPFGAAAYNAPLIAPSNRYIPPAASAKFIASTSQVFV